MSDDTATHEKGRLTAELLRKLDNPLGFIGESRLTHICFDGRWTAVDEVFERARRSSRSKDRVMSLLRKRLQEIRSGLRSDRMSRDEARSMFEEGIAVKHAIYVINNNVLEEGDPHEDIKRWIRYGRSLG